MKYLMGTAISMILGILPSIAAEGVIDDPFFTSPQTVCSIRTFIPDGITFKAIVDGTNEKLETKTVTTKPLGVLSSWRLDDQNHIGTQINKITVVVGTKTLEKEQSNGEIFYKEKQRNKVNVIENIEYSSLNLPFRISADQIIKIVYDRPDGTEYIENSGIKSKICTKVFFGNTEIIHNSDLFKLPYNIPVDVVAIETNALSGEELNRDMVYQIMLKNTVTSLGVRNRCYQHENETSTRGFKIVNNFRHWWEQFAVTEVMHELIKITPDKQEIPFLKGDPKVYAISITRDSGRTNKPECTDQIGNAQIVTQLPDLTINPNTLPS